MVSDRARHLRFRLLLRGAALLAAAALSAPAAAQSPEPSPADKETARSLMDQGDARMTAKDYPAALKAFRAADAIMHLPQTAIAMAKAQLAAGLLIEALDTATQIAGLPPKPGDAQSASRARQDAAVLADQVAPLIPSLEITVDGAPADVSVSVDGNPIPAAALIAPRKVNPGPHVVTATARGFAPARAEVTVTPRSTTPVKLKLVALPPSVGPVGPGDGVPPSTPPVEKKRRLSVLVPVGFSIAGVGLVVGAATGAVTLGLGSTLKGECGAGGTCPHSAHDDLQKAQALANVADVALAVGAVGVVLGVVGLVRGGGRSEPAAQARITPLVGPGFVGLQGAF